MLNVCKSYWTKSLPLSYSKKKTMNTILAGVIVHMIITRGNTMIPNFEKSTGKRRKYNPSLQKWQKLLFFICRTTYHHAVKSALSFLASWPAKFLKCFWTVWRIARLTLLTEGYINDQSFKSLWKRKTRPWRNDSSVIKKMWCPNMEWHFCVEILILQHLPASYWLTEIN